MKKKFLKVLMSALLFGSVSFYNSDVSAATNDFSEVKNLIQDEFQNCDDWKDIRRKQKREDRRHERNEDRKRYEKERQDRERYERESRERERRERERRDRKRWERKYIERH